MLPICKGIGGNSEWGNVAVSPYRGLKEWRIWFWLVRCWPDTCTSRHRRVPPRVYIGSSPLYQVSLLWSSRLLWFFSPPAWVFLFCDLTTSPANNVIFTRRIFFHKIFDYWLPIKLMPFLVMKGQGWPGIQNTFMHMTETQKQRTKCNTIKLNLE